MTSDQEKPVPDLAPASKPTNPKDAIASISKAPLVSVVPWRVVPASAMGTVADWLALAMLEGALKYGVFNYRTAGGRASIYFDAADRHLRDYERGVETDIDSGLPHLVKALASLVVLSDCEIGGNWVDDRDSAAGMFLSRLDEEYELPVERGIRGDLRRFWARDPDAPSLSSLIDALVELCDGMLPSLSTEDLNAHALRLRKAHEARIAAQASAPNPSALRSELIRSMIRSWSSVHRGFEADCDGKGAVEIQLELIGAFLRDLRKIEEVA